MVKLSAVAGATQIISIVCSFLAGMHQLYLGYVFEGSDGFSPILLLGWLLGDVCNVLGTFWTHQLVFQQVISCASLLNDVALASQHFYYKRKHSRIHTVPDPLPMGPGRFLVIQWNALLRPYILFSLVSAARAYSVSPSNNLITQVIGAEPDDDEFIDWEFLIGQCMAWLAMLSYSFALVPQVVENFARKSTGSVSIAMFLADAISSANYLLTILITAYGKPSHHKMVDFLLEELPYIFGTGMCALLDCVLLFQYFCYPQFVVQIAIDEHDPTPSYSYGESTSLQPVRSWKSYSAVDRD